MILGIDASNIRGGGGITHLRELLGNAVPGDFGFRKVIVWSGEKILDQLEAQPWLEKVHLKVLDKGIWWRSYWQKFRLSQIVKDANCDLLYIPGGSYAGFFQPVVAFHQNLLPFEWKELLRYGFSLMTVKMMALRITQSVSFQNANGVVYLTNYARRAVEKVIGPTPGKAVVIPHGVNERFFRDPSGKDSQEFFAARSSFRIVYVSIIDVYKHQWQVAKAVDILKKEGWPVQLEFIGPSNPKAMKKLQQTMNMLDPEKAFISYFGSEEHFHIQDIYKSTDIFVFASSCETFGQIVLEAMASGLAIACSERSAMPDILQDAGLYFNPEYPVSIAGAIRKYMESNILRKEMAKKAYLLAKNYSWKACADKTFKFFRDTTQT